MLNKVMLCCLFEYNTTDGERELKYLDENVVEIEVPYHERDSGRNKYRTVGVIRQITLGTIKTKNSISVVNGAGYTDEKCVPGNISSIAEIFRQN